MLAIAGVHAQEQAPEADTARQLDSLQQVVNQLTSNVETLEKENLNRKIWKDRAKYFNLGYVNQTVTDKTFGGEIKSDFGVSLSNGKTYYLHKKPIVGMIKFGLDWTWLDINYAKSTLESVDFETDEVYTAAMHQADIGMQFGPSVTVNPIHHLKVSGYFRFAPSYSLLYAEDAFFHNYVSMWNAGCSVSWKVFSVGVEWRWGTAKYDIMDDDKEGMDNDSKVRSTRFYIGFRF